MGIAQINYMKKTCTLFTVLIITFFAGVSAQTLPSQSITAVSSPAILRTYKVGIFAPLYLDSVFKGDNYKYSKKFPTFTLPGLEFIQGAQVALDSLKVPNGNLHAAFYDTKSYSQNLASLIGSKKLDSLDLIIGSVKDSDYLQLANFALQKNIPFISATYPNDAGIKANPFVVIVNSTLRAHCEGIYSYLLQNHGTNDKIFLVRKQGAQEDKIAGYFKQMNEPDGKPLLNIQTINVTDNLLALENKLDTAHENVIIGGSLDEKFATKLATAANTYNNTAAVKLIGMPNWDNFAVIKKNSLKDFPIYFTSPYYNVKYDAYSKMLKNAYLKKYKGNPGDMSYKGFEIVYLFSSLLAKYPDDFMSHLNGNTEKIFTEYNFKPVFTSKQSKTPDYFENKHLYLIKATNGVFTRAL